jgi:hypothetical protein
LSVARQRTRIVVALIAASVALLPATVASAAVTQSAVAPPATAEVTEFQLPASSFGA